MWFISAFFLTCFVYVYGLLWDNPKCVLWQQVAPKSKQSSCVPQALTFHLFSGNTNTNTSFIGSHCEVSPISLRQGRALTPTGMEGGMPTPIIQSSSKAVCFPVVDSNDYTWSLKSCMCGFIFWFKECLRSTVQQLFTSCSRTSLPGPSSPHQSYNLKTQVTHMTIRYSI